MNLPDFPTSSVFYNYHESSSLQGGILLRLLNFLALSISVLGALLAGKVLRLLIFRRGVKPQGIFANDTQISLIFDLSLNHLDDPKIVIPLPYVTA